MRPADHIETAVVGHIELLNAASSLRDSETREPSLLPGWSRARVIAHLAHKTWSHVAVFDGARVGEVRAQYPQGQASAEVETADWSAKPAAELCELLADGFSALERAWVQLSDDAWGRAGTSSAGARSMTQFVDRHMRDVFVHHVDLDVGYRPVDWPELFVRTELDKRLRDLPDRADPPATLAWLLGRAPAPELGPW